MQEFPQLLHVTCHLQVLQKVLLVDDSYKKSDAKKVRKATRDELFSLSHRIISKNMLRFPKIKANPLPPKYPNKSTFTLSVLFN